MNHLLKLKADICFLQETRITHSESEQLQFKQYNKNILNNIQHKKKAFEY